MICKTTNFLESGRAVKISSIAMSMVENFRERQFLEKGFLESRNNLISKVLIEKFSREVPSDE